MSIIRCYECGNEISDKAERCPHCGAVKKKYCQHCGALIDTDCIVCPQCGKQVGNLNQNEHNIVINNSSSASASASASAVASVNMPIADRKNKNKWVAFFLCLFLGMFGVHKFYEGKIGMGILYFCTFGFIGIGVVIDLISILMKPNPYYV